MKLLTLARDLKRRKAREKQGLFVAEGVRAVEELSRSPLEIIGILVTPQLAEAPRGAALRAALDRTGARTEEVSPSEFASAAETESPQGVIALAAIPRRDFADIATDWKGIILVLDAVQDPGNVGTIVRTAAALGATATVAMPGTVDLWNAKVVRSGMGSHFRHLVFASTWAELDRFRSAAGATVLGADAAGEPLPAEPPRRALLIVGNEGEGLSTDGRSRADHLVALRIAPDVESLNVAVATGILLHQLRQ